MSFKVGSYVEHIFAKSYKPGLVIGPTKEGELIAVWEDTACAGGYWVNRTADHTPTLPESSLKEFKKHKHYCYIHFPNEWNNVTPFEVGSYVIETFNGEKRADMKSPGLVVGITEEGKSIVVWDDDCEAYVHNKTKNHIPPLSGSSLEEYKKHKCYAYIHFPEQWKVVPAPKVNDQDKKEMENSNKNSYAVGDKVIVTIDHKDYVGTVVGIYDSIPVVGFDEPPIDGLTHQYVSLKIPNNTGHEAFKDKYQSFKFVIDNKIRPLTLKDRKVGETFMIGDAKVTLIDRIDHPLFGLKDQEVLAFHDMTPIGLVSPIQLNRTTDNPSSVIMSPKVTDKIRSKYTSEYLNSFAGFRMNDDTRNWDKLPTKDVDNSMVAKEIKEVIAEAPTVTVKKLQDVKIGSRVQCYLNKHGAIMYCKDDRLSQEGVVVGKTKSGFPIVFWNAMDNCDAAIPVSYFNHDYNDKSSEILAQYKDAMCFHTLMPEYEVQVNFEPKEKEMKIKSINELKVGSKIQFTLKDNFFSKEGKTLSQEGTYVGKSTYGYNVIFWSERGNNANALPIDSLGQYVTDQKMLLEITSKYKDAKYFHAVSSRHDVQVNFEPGEEKMIEETPPTRRLADRDCGEVFFMEFDGKNVEVCLLAKDPEILAFKTKDRVDGLEPVSFNGLFPKVRQRLIGEGRESVAKNFAGFLVNIKGRNFQDKKITDFQVGKNNQPAVAQPAVVVAVGKNNQPNVAQPAAVAPVVSKKVCDYKVGDSFKVKYGSCCNNEATVLHISDNGKEMVIGYRGGSAPGASYDNFTMADRISHLSKEVLSQFSKYHHYDHESLQWETTASTLPPIKLESKTLSDMQEGECFQILCGGIYQEVVLLDKSRLIIGYRTSTRGIVADNQLRSKYGKFLDNFKSFHNFSSAEKREVKVSNLPAIKFNSKPLSNAEVGQNCSISYGNQPITNVVVLGIDQTSIYVGYNDTFYGAPLKDWIYRDRLNNLSEDTLNACKGFYSIPIDHAKTLQMDESTTSKPIFVKLKKDMPAAAPTPTVINQHAIAADAVEVDIGELEKKLMSNIETSLNSKVEHIHDTYNNTYKSQFNVIGELKKKNALNEIEMANLKKEIASNKNETATLAAAAAASVLIAQKAIEAVAKPVEKPVEKTETSVKIEPKTINSNKEKEAKKMSNNFWDMVKEDAKNAAYRSAATQLTKGTKFAIVQLMESKGQKIEAIQAVKELLDTEAGEAVIAVLLGLGLTYAPKVSEDPRAQKLATEFRVNGMSTGINAVVGTLTENFVPLIQGVMSGLPEPEETPVRIAAPEKTAEETEHEQNAAGVSRAING